MTQATTIRATDTLADLAATRAGASRAFARRNLDFCCHGQISLADVCAKKGIDVATLIGEIAAEERSDDDFQRWDDRSIPDLVEHLIGHYHDPHRAELPRLVAMAERVEKVHADKPTCPRGLARHLVQLEADLRLHMEKEETILFPMLVQGAGAGAAGPIQVMEREHEDAGAILTAMRKLTTNHTPPPEACGTWRALYLGLAEFERDLMQHVCLENYVLFPRALRA